MNNNLEKIITINELFSGIGAQRKAFERLGIPHEVVGICEIDKYAIQSYEAMFGKTKNYGDICTTPRLDYADLWTYSFPCQDISVAGNQKGINENTRSGLLYQVQRLLEVAKEEGTTPKYLLLENVKNLVGKKFKHQFLEWIEYLDKLGYNTYWQVLNAKNYGVPQNRERVFAVSIRKDLNQKFEFPKSEVLTKRLADVLEDEVDEKYYLSQDKVETLIKNLEQTGCVAVKEVDNYVVENRIVQVGNIVSTGNWNNPQRGRIYSTDGLSPALNTVGGGGLEPKIIEGVIHKVNIPQTVRVRKYEVDNEKLVALLRNHKTLTNRQIAESLNVPVTKVEHWFRTDDSFAIPDAEIWYQLKELLNIETNEYDEAITTFEEKEGVYEKSNRCYLDTGIAPTLTSSSCDEKIITNLRIRKLTPLECWRLMGFDDNDFQKAQQSGVSNSQLYKQAGNSIVVDVLEKIFKNLLKEVE